jgi:hypothetical protein
VTSEAGQFGIEPYALRQKSATLALGALPNESDSVPIGFGFFESGLARCEPLLRLLVLLFECRNQRHAFLNPLSGVRVEKACERTKLSQALEDPGPVVALEVERRALEF